MYDKPKKSLPPNRNRLEIFQNLKNNIHKHNQKYFLLKLRETNKILRHQSGFRVISSRDHRIFLDKTPEVSFLKICQFLYVI